MKICHFHILLWQVLVCSPNHRNNVLLLQLLLRTLIKDLGLIIIGIIQTKIYPDQEHLPFSDLDKWRDANGKDSCIKAIVVSTVLLLLILRDLWMKNAKCFKGKHYPHIFRCFSDGHYRKQ